MKCTITKIEKITGTVVVPSSKSESIRALVFALLTSGTSKIENILACEDTKTAIKVCKELWAKITRSGNAIIVQSIGVPKLRVGKKIETGDSGITTRFILPTLGFRKDFETPIIFICGSQMRNRPIGSLVSALNSLGMNITFKNKEGFCPLKVSGELIGGKATIEGITSQYLSALLISLPLAQIDSEITVKDLHERPYIEMTLRWLDMFKIKYSHKRYRSNDVFTIFGKQKYSSFRQAIPGDFSGASSLIAAGCLTEGKVVLKGLDMRNSQGDKKLLAILKKMGADIRVKKEMIEIYGGKELKGITIDANDIPDLLPVLAIVGTFAAGKTKITNVAQARIKETDRIKSMCEGLKKLGARVEEHKDGLTVYKSSLYGSKVNGYKDHRTVMAFVVAGTIAEGETQVSNAEAVQKTFPKFYQSINAIGAKIKLTK